MSTNDSFTLSSQEVDGPARNNVSNVSVPVSTDPVANIAEVVQRAVEEGIRRGLREAQAPLLKKIQSLEKTINSQTVTIANATRELKEIQVKLDKGQQPLGVILTKAGVLKVRKAAWLNPGLLANSSKELELLKTLWEEMKEAGDVLKFDAKSQDDFVKGFHYERNQLKGQIKSRVKSDLRLKSEQACLLPSTLSYLQTHLVDTSEDVPIVAFQLGYTMAKYLNKKVSMIGDAATKQQKEAIKDVWDVVTKRLLVDPSGVEVLKDKIRSSLLRGYQPIDDSGKKKATVSDDQE